MAGRTSPAGRRHRLSVEQVEEQGAVVEAGRGVAGLGAGRGGQGGHRGGAPELPAQQSRTAPRPAPAQVGEVATLCARVELEAELWLCRPGISVSAQT